MLRMCEAFEVTERIMERVVVCMVDVAARRDWAMRCFPYCHVEALSWVVGEVVLTEMGVFGVWIAAVGSPVKSDDFDSGHG